MELLHHPHGSKVLLVVVVKLDFFHFLFWIKFSAVSDPRMDE